MPSKTTPWFRYKTDMKHFLLCFYFFFFCIGTTQAQWYKASVKGVRKNLHLRQVENRVSQALVQRQQRALSRQALPAPLNNAVLTIKENHRFWRRIRTGTSTAFVIEETYQGKRFLWGVTAAHGTFFKVAVIDPQTENKLKVPFAITGGVSDIALFALSDPLPAQLTPLKLAPQNPQLGETLFSVGFFQNRYNLETNRVVEEAGPHRLLTSLQIDRSCERTGACGGPLLNAQGQVVAVHVGSHKSKDAGFAVPVQKIHELLQDYHNGTLSQDPLIFNGINIGSIGRNQFIRSVYVYQNGKMIQEINVCYAYKTKNIDYAHLETLVNAPQADKLVFNIVENIFASEEQKQQLKAFVLTYDLTTGQVTYKQNNFQHPLYKRAINKAKREAAKILIPGYQYKTP